MLGHNKKEFQDMHYQQVRYQKHNSLKAKTHCIKSRSKEKTVLYPEYKILYLTSLIGRIQRNIVLEEMIIITIPYLW